MTKNTCIIRFTNIFDTFPLLARTAAHSWNIIICKLIYSDIQRSFLIFSE